MIHLENEVECGGRDFDAAHYARKPPFPWFGGKSKAAAAVWGSPARAGMALGGFRLDGGGLQFPRPRGDGPAKSKI